MPSCFLACALVRARTKIQSAYCAIVVQVFCPEITQPSVSLRALVLKLARSDPAPGSDKPGTTSREIDDARQEALFLLLEPNVDHRADHADAERTSSGALPRCVSSRKIESWIGLQPVPPHAGGQWGAAQPLCRMRVQRT